MYTESLRAFLKPVLAFLDDDSVTEVMINGPDEVWIERSGKLYRTDARFTEEGLLGAARNVAQFVGRPLSDERPRLDARLPDGSRIHVVLPPVARRGTTIAIRKFFKDKLSVDALMQYGSISRPMARLLDAAIQAKLNIIVAGGTGSGKTTLLNILSSLIPNEERILTIEDSSELQLNQEHLISFESRPADKYGKGEVNMGDLLHSALRLRPDRIVVGEVRGGECFHLLQAMNTGHAGSLSTCHANTPVDTLRRLESLCLMSAVEMPLVAVRAQVASAISLVVCCERLNDGTRRVTAISEVLPLNDKGEYRVQDLFVFTTVAKDEHGRMLGYHAPTGILPRFLPKVRALGFDDIDEKFFDPKTYGLPPPPQYFVGEDVSVRWVGSLKHREQGLPDPEAFREELAQLEAKLKAEARDVPRPSPAAVPAAARSSPPAPRASPAKAAAKPAPKAEPPVRTEGRRVDLQDRTPPPSRAPVARVEKSQSAAITRDEDAPEASVQVSQELVQDAAAQNTAIRHYPPKPPQKSAARESNKSNEKTDVRPAPERNRR